MGVSKRVARSLLKSVQPSTLVGYQRQWRSFHSWFHRKPGSYSCITVDVVAKYLLFVFHNPDSSGGLRSGSYLNSVRSAISFFVQYSIPNLGYDLTITRLFSFFYKCRPSFPRYCVTWDVGQVLRFISKWHPPSSLSTKLLTLKTVSLIALTSCDRAQTLHALSVEKVHISANGVVFVVPSVLKTSKRGKPAQTVECVSWDEDSLDVCSYVHAYINRTFMFRWRAVQKGFEKPTQFFLSHRTGRPVCRGTISRWIREVLVRSGIDMSLFGPGSTRGASASAASRRGASASQIMAAGNWTNLGTFQRFYKRTVDTTPVGRLILAEASVSGT